MENDEKSKMSYRESRTINIGQYENVTSELFVSTNIRRFNKVDKTIEISYTEHATMDDFEKDFEDTFKMVQRNVRKALNTRERQIRTAALDFTAFSAPELERKIPKDSVCYNWTKKKEE